MLDFQNNYLLTQLFKLILKYYIEPTRVIGTFDITLQPFERVVVLFSMFFRSIFYYQLQVFLEEYPLTKICCE